MSTKFDIMRLLNLCVYITPSVGNENMVFMGKLN